MDGDEDHRGGHRLGGLGGDGGGDGGGGGGGEEQQAVVYIRLATVEVGERVGSGALGEVRRGIWNGVVVALKGLHMLRTDAASQAEWGGALSPAERAGAMATFRRECETMRGLVHPNILPFIGVVIDDNPAAEPLYLATQFISTGTLHDLIYQPRHAVLRSAEGNLLPTETQLVIFTGMFAGLEFLAARRLIHRDIKPANILVVIEGGSLVKVLLADFGEAKQLTRTMTRVVGTIAGSPVYMAPEMRETDEATSPKADVFSAGVVVIEVNTGRQPNPGPEARREGRRRVFVDEEERRAGDLAAVRSPEVLELARRCIVDDEAERADAAEMVRRCRGLIGVVEAPVVRITLFVMNLADGQRLRLQVNSGTQVTELKRRLSDLTGLRPEQHQLVFAGRRLEDTYSVDDYNLLDGTVVHLLAKPGAGAPDADETVSRDEQTRRDEVAARLLHRELQAELREVDQRAHMEHQAVEDRERDARQEREDEVVAQRLQRELEAEVQRMREDEAATQRLLRELEAEAERQRAEAQRQAQEAERQRAEAQAAAAALEVVQREQRLQQAQEAERQRAQQLAAEKARGPPAVLRVSGAGSPEVNGDYRQDGACWSSPLHLPMGVLVVKPRCWRWYCRYYRGEAQVQESRQWCYNYV